MKNYKNICFIILVVLGGLLLQGISSCETDNNLLEQAKTKWKSRKFNEAIKLFRDVIAMSHDSKDKAMAQLGVGSSYFHLNEYDNAIVELTPLLTAGQDQKIRSMAEFYLGGAYYENRDYGKALEYFQDVVNTYPNFKHYDLAKRSLARCFFMKDDHGKALTIYEDVIDSKGQDFLGSTDFRYLGYMYDNEGDYDRSREMYKRLIETTSDDNPAVEVAKLYIAEGFDNQGNKGEAILHYEQFIDSYPASKQVGRAKHKLGKCYASLYQNNKAILTLEEAIRDYGDLRYNKLSLHILGCLYLEGKQYDKAERPFKRVIEDYPQSSVAKSSRKKLSELEKIRSEEKSSKVKEKDSSPE